jgi:PKD repeat protein
MKQKFFFYAAGILLIIFSACKKEPTASFIHSSDTYEALDTINFASTSSDANNFQWDFGDGSTSTNENPWHIFSSSGSFDVSLTVTNDDGSDETISTVTIKDPTILAFGVVKSGTEEKLSNCAIYVYDNQTDWESGENPIATGLTDDNGIIIFYHAKAIIYYLDAYKEETGGVWWFTGYTGTIQLNHVNTYTVPVEWYPDGKKATDHQTKLPKLLEKIN